MLEPRSLLALNLGGLEKWVKILAVELDGCIQIFALLFIGHATFNRLLNFSVPHFPNPNFPMIPTSSGCGGDNLLCNVELLAHCLVLSKHSKDVICGCSNYQQSKLILSVD